MTQVAQGTNREPTMEEILASIRRIIEDNNPPPLADGESADASEVAEFQKEFGENAIAESLQHAGAMTALGQMIGAKNVPQFDSESLVSAAVKPVIAPTVEKEYAPAPMAAFQPAQKKNEEKPMAAVEHVELREDDLVIEPEADISTPFERQLRPILSDIAGRQVHAAFSDLTSAIEKERQQSLAEIAEDMIRPMLQEWLDNNLPTMVERLVREEIERVARGPRR
jgi:uncharacterized protein